MLLTFFFLYRYPAASTLRLHMKLLLMVMQIIYMTI